MARRKRVAIELGTEYETSTGFMVIEQHYLVRKRLIISLPDKLRTVIDVYEAEDKKLIAIVDKYFNMLISFKENNDG